VLPNRMSLHPGLLNLAQIIQCFLRSNIIMLSVTYSLKMSFLTPGRFAYPRLKTTGLTLQYRLLRYLQICSDRRYR
jgi:hypothetical protein